MGRTRKTKGDQKGQERIRGDKERPGGTKEGHKEKPGETKEGHNGNKVQYKEHFNYKTGIYKKQKDKEPQGQGRKQGHRNWHFWGEGGCN